MELELSRGDSKFVPQAKDSSIHEEYVLVFEENRAEPNVTLTQKDEDELKKKRFRRFTLVKRIQKVCELSGYSHE
jgi:hypothetical protein